MPLDHHPLSTPRANDRADIIHAWMLAYQRRHGEPPKLEDVKMRIGPKSVGLLSIYLRKLAAAGRARKMKHYTQGRCGRWEAI
jgi:hypothetical protein